MGIGEELRSVWRVVLLPGHHVHGGFPLVLIHNRLRVELDEKLTKVADTISKAVTVNEANKVHTSIARELSKAILIPIR